MDKRVPVKTIYLLSIISIGLIGLAVGSTFAMFEASATINNPISLSSSLTYSEEVLQTINIILDAEEEKELTLNITNSTTSTMYYSAWYLNEGQNIDFATDDDTTGTIAGVTSETLTITIRNNTSRTINVTIGVSTSGDNNIVLSTGMTLIPKQEMPFKVTKLTTYISKLYNDASKSTVTNNSITYNTAPSVSLMNDRLGGTTESLDDGNIRYYGSDPYNYVYFNCSDYDDQDDSTCEKWRIIGIIETTKANNFTKNLVKIIKNDSLVGTFSYDNKNISTGAETDRGSNDWTTARLMKLLNPSDYYTVDANDNGYGQSLYYNSENGYAFVGLNNGTQARNFTSTGIKNNETRNMIAEVKLNIGGWNSEQLYPNQIYQYERGTTVYTGRPTTWVGKIALMYPSDYSYATDLNSCTQKINGYDNSTCSGNNWLFKNKLTWTLSPNSANANGSWYILANGRVGSNGSGFSALSVYPTLYLDANTMVVDGDGTSTNPYKLG